LIPLDGSELGEAALEYMGNFLSGLSPEKKATVILLHVVNTFTHDVSVQGGGLSTINIPYTDDEMVKLKEERKSYLSKAAQSLKSAGTEVELQLVTGKNPAEEIIKAEAEFNCDLVAMSTHGRSGLSRWAFGSVTDKVLKAGQVPVLMIRAEI
jgi:nucleotide-binding universal stress UspA family protein